MIFNLLSLNLQFNNLILLTLLCNLLFFTVDLLNKKFSLNVVSIPYVINRTIYTTIFALIALLITKPTIFLYDITSLLKVSACAALCGMALYLFIESLKYLKFSNILFIQLLGQLFHQFIGYFIFKEEINNYLIVSAIFSSLGILVQSSIPDSKKGLFLAIISTLLWTLGYSLMSIPLKQVSTSISVFVVEFTLLFLYMLLALFQKKLMQSFKFINFDKRMLLVGFLTVTGAYMINYVYSKYAISSIGVVNLIVVPLFVFISLRINREKFTRLELVGNSLVFLGYLFILL
jgi:hypothetical protein